MKLLKANIRPEELDDIQDAIDQVITLQPDDIISSEIKEFSQENQADDSLNLKYKNVDYQIDYKPALLIELTVPDDKANEVSKAITSVSETNVRIENIEKYQRIINAGTSKPTQTTTQQR